MELRGSSLMISLLSETGFKPEFDTAYRYLLSGLDLLF